jgi:hypothetical protein
MYVTASGGLGDFRKGQCPPISGDDLKLIVAALDARRDYPAQKRINAVTDAVFIRRHPERWDQKELKIIKLPPLRSAGPAERDLIQDWGHIRDCLVIPVHQMWSRATSRG